MSEFSVVEPGYCDLAEEAQRHLASRLYRRRRLLSAIRGYLRQESSPRWIVVGLLALSVLAAVAAGWLLGCLGLEGWTVKSSLSVAAAWPVFLALLRRRAGTEFLRMHLDGDLNAFIARDDRETAAENAPRSLSNQTHEAIVHSISRESGRAAGQGCLFAIVLLAALTAGMWLVWDLIRRTPELLATLILDVHFVPANPNLYRRVESDQRCRDVTFLTACYFFFFAIVALVVGGDLWILLYRLHGRG